MQLCWKGIYADIEVYYNIILMYVNIYQEISFPPQFPDCCHHHSPALADLLLSFVRIAFCAICPPMPLSSKFGMHINSLVALLSHCHHTL